MAIRRDSLEYQRIRPLGRGGMAETWLGRRTGPGGIDQRVCLKFIREEFARLPDFLSAFEREARIVSGLRHQNIVSLIGFDQRRGALVLELVDGADLRALLEAMPEHRLSVELTAYIATELCKALRYTHSFMSAGKPAGIVHRDISASNVLLSYSGEVKLADFGVADAISAVNVGETVVAGKRPYMSPEQAKGLELDGRSDLFAVGVLLYEMLAGRRPFDRYGNGHPLDTRYRGEAGEYTQLQAIAPHVPSEFCQIVERLLQPDPEDRFADAQACALALAAVAPASRTSACFELGRLVQQTKPHETLVEQHSERSSSGASKRWRAGWAAASALLLAVLLWSPFSAMLREPASKPRASALAPSELSLTPPPREDAASVSAELSSAAAVPSVPERSVDGSGAEHPSQMPRPITARLTIGAFPASTVWLDGRKVGGSPVELSVSVGRHRVAAGGAKPEVTREVEVLPNKRNGVLLELPP